MKKFLALIVAAVCLLTATFVYAAIQVFDGTGQYIMSDFENHDIAKQRAQQRAERDAQKRAGVAIKTFSRTIDSELADDEVSAVMNDIISVFDVKIVPVPFEADGEAGLMYRATLKASIDTDGIYDWLKRDDTDKVNVIRRNAQLQDAIDKNDEQVDALKEQYTRAATQAERDQIRQQMNQADRDFLANRKVDEGNKLAYAKDYNGAIRLYNEALQLKPNFVMAYNNRGTAYNNLSQYDRALADLDAAIELKPDFAEAYNNRGFAYNHLNQNERAIADYSTAIELKPDFADAYNNRGFAYFSQQQCERAIQDYTTAIELNPNNATTYINRSAAYFLLEQYDRALADLDAAIELKPDDAGVYVGRGVCWQRLGDEAKARADFARARQLGWKG